MSGGEIVAGAKIAAELGKKALANDGKVGEVLLKAAENTPEMKAAARSHAARIAVKEQVKLKILQPFARMIGVSRKYFEDTFPDEMAVKIVDIPEEHLITPPPSTAVPALLGLSYTFEEPSLKEMYLNLIATASDDRRTNQAHPAFSEIIKQLSPKEATLLNSILSHTQITAVRLKNVLDEPIPGSSSPLMNHLLPITENGVPVVEPQVPTWVDNWRRLGLVDVKYDEYQTGEDAYAWVTERPEYIELAADPSVTRLEFDKGLVQRTAFGQQFLSAVS